MAITTRARKRAQAPVPGGDHAADAVKVKNRTGNAKVGDAAVTYASQATCPDECPFRNSGCYAESGPLSWSVTSKLNRASATDPVAIAQAEAAAIDTLPADRDMRLHGVGDSATRRGTRALAAAVGRYLDRAKKVLVRGTAAAARVWTYTHAWRKVPRSDWGRTSVLASCESAAEAKDAMKRGYAAALVVDAFESEGVYEEGGVRVLPCPNQTRGAVCTSCRLCFDDDRLREAGLVIAFVAHGNGKRRVAEKVRRISLETV
jgi:hypothetical protein